MSTVKPSIIGNQSSDNLPVAYFDEVRKVYELFVTGSVYGYAWYLEYLQEAKKMGYSLEVHIFSFGGSAFEGIAMHDYIKANFSDNSKSYVYGIAASAASVIACACNETYIGSNSGFMVHLPYSDASGNEATIAMLVDAYANIYSQKTGKSKEDCIALMERGTNQNYTMTAAEAIENGFCDAVIENEAVAFLEQNSNNMNFLKKVQAMLAGKDVDEVQDPAPAADPTTDPAPAEPKAESGNAEILAAIKTATSETTGAIQGFKTELEAIKAEHAEIKASLELTAKAVGVKLAKGADAPQANAQAPAVVIPAPAVEDKELNVFQAAFMDTIETK